MNVRHQHEPERHKREYDSRDPAGAARSGESPRKAKRAIAARREPDEDRDGVHRQRTEAERVEREKWQRDPVTVFAEGERIAQRIKQVRVKEIQWVGKRLVVIPPKNPGNEIGIARTG